jgi:hypothetical protein
LGGAGSANFVANQPLILPLMGHLILSTKQELNYGGVRTISALALLKILGFVPTKDKQLIYLPRFINCGIANSFSRSTTCLRSKKIARTKRMDYWKRKRCGNACSNSSGL